VTSLLGDFLAPIPWAFALSSNSSPLTYLQEEEAMGIGWTCKINYAVRLTRSQLYDLIGGRRFKLAAIEACEEWLEDPYPWVELQFKAKLIADVQNLAARLQHELHRIGKGFLCSLYKPKHSLASYCADADGADANDTYERAEHDTLSSLPIGDIRVNDIWDAAVNSCGLVVDFNSLGEDVCYVSASGGIDIFDYNSGHDSEKFVSWENEEDLAPRCGKQEFDTAIKRFGWDIKPTYIVYHDCR
jgi:hypothetical protein